MISPLPNSHPPVPTSARIPKATTSRKPRPTIMSSTSSLWDVSRRVFSVSNHLSLSFLLPRHSLTNYWPARDVRERRRLDREPTPVPEEETLSTTPIDREPTPVPEEETLSTTPIAGPHRVPPIPSVPGPAPLVQSIAIPPPSIDHDPLMMDLNTIDYNQLSTDVAFISSMHAAFEAAGPISPDQIGHINTSLFDPGLPTVYTAQAASLDTPALSGVASSGPIAAPPAASPPAPVACPPTVSASAAPAPAESSPSQATSKQRKKPKPRPVRNTTSSKAQAAANVTATPTAPVEEPAQPVPEGATLTRSGRASKGARPADADWADNGKTQNKNKRGPDKENVDVAPR